MYLKITNYRYERTDYRYKTQLRRESVAENNFFFFTWVGSSEAREGAHSALTRGRTQPHTGVQDLPRHRHSDPRLSVSFQSQTRWMAGEWKSWLKPHPLASFQRERERPSILFATTLTLRGLPPPRYSTLRSRIIPPRVSLFSKYKYISKEDLSVVYLIAT